MCAILKRVNSLILPYVKLNEMSLVPNTSPHLLNINIGSKYYAMFVWFLKHTPLKLVLYTFMNQIYEKYTVHVCLVLKKTCVPLWLWRRWGQKFGQFIPFPPKETFTILSTICVPLNCLKAEIFIDYAP